ncbi:MAG: hypothetical protein HZB86_10670 [Deltaproteobacteria bacterium]|nr:hypothetical protein [Deltaproteobacteria bacterium]
MKKSGGGGSLVLAFAVLFFYSSSASGYTLLDGNFELKGFVRHITAVRTENPKGGLGGDQFKSGEVELSKSFLQVEGTYTVNPGLKVYSRWRGAYDASFDFKGQEKFPPAVVDDQRLENEIRELYVDVRRGPLFVRLGKQQVVWGESDGLRLADIINPLDFSWHYFLEDWQDIRQGLPMIRAIYGVAPKTDLELVWAPVSFKPAKWAGVGTFWEFPGAGIGGIPEKKYDTNVRNGSVGGKVKTTLGSGLDVSLYDYYHRFEMPSPELSSTGLEFAHPFVNSIGGTFNVFADPVKTVFRGEAVYNQDEPHTDFTKPNFISKKNTIAFMLGADRPTYLPINSESSFLSFQVFYKQVLSPDDTTIMFGDSAAPGKKDSQTMISGFISTPYTYLIPNAILTPSFFVFYDVIGAGWMRPMVNLKYGDNFSVSLAWNKFWGHKDGRGFFDPFSDRSEAYIDLKYSFQ